MHTQLLHDDLNEENERQITAIKHWGNKNLVIIAGPGTGKTRVIIKRISHLIHDKDVNAENILIVTFTNRAINEILHRIKHKSLFVYKIRYAGTLHSIARKLMTKFKDQLHLINHHDIHHINVFDEVDSHFFLEKWWEDKQLNPLRFNSKTLITYIRNTKHYNYIKWNKHNPNIFKHTLYGDEKEITDIALLKEVFVAYRQHLIDNQKFDFEDLLIMFHQMLIKPETGLREWCQKEFSHILVDEFQDMNALQLEIIKELSGANYNICCVGDPNQAIYSFQGAHPKIFSDFRDMYPDKVKEIHLDENYRSTKKILDLSNKLIAINKPDQEVNVYTKQNLEGENISIYSIISLKNEKKWLLNKVEELKSQGVKLKDIAILYRSKSISEKFKKLFSESSIKFIDYNHSNLLNNLMVNIIVCYLILCFDEDSFSIRFLVEFFYQEEKITLYTLEKISSLAQEKYNNSWFTALFHVQKEHELDEKDNEFIDKFKDLITTLQTEFGEYKYQIFDKKDLSYFVTTVLKKVRKSFDNQNLLTHTVSIFQFYRSTFRIWYFVKHEKNIYEYVKHMLLYVKYFQAEQEDDCLNFSTIHSVKGCEFDHVILLGVTENIMPSSYAVNDVPGSEKIIRSTIEEERRMFYVAITRAKQHLYLIHRENANKGKTYSPRSRFLDEIQKIKSIKYLEENQITSSNIGSFTSAKTNTHEESNQDKKPKQSSKTKKVKKS